MTTRIETSFAGEPDERPASTRGRSGEHAQPALVLGYGLAAPSASEAVAALARILGEGAGRAAWVAACRRAGIDGPVEPLGRRRFRAAVSALAASGGVAGIVGHALTIRIRTYDRLAERQDASRPRLSVERGGVA
jgi:hypothetical protein